MGKLIFITGGARSGKSTFAQQLAQRVSTRVVLIATAEALDDEMAERIWNHQKARPSSWITIEAPMNISEKLIQKKVFGDVVIVDCLTLLVSNIFLQSINENKPNETNIKELIRKEYLNLMKLIDESSSLWIIVSNEVGLGIVPGDLTSRLYRDLLGRMNQWVAEKADEVYFMIAGIPVPIQQFRS